MTTIFDAFAKVIEKAPCKQSDLGFKSPVYSHLSRLVDMKFIKKTKSGYIPIKSKRTEAVFRIIKYSINNGLNYNIIFQKDFINVVSVIKNDDLRPKELENNQQKLSALRFLEENQFILVRKKRPKKGTLLKHKAFDELSKYYKRKIVVNESFDKNILSDVLQIPEIELNPFDRSYFGFLTGSAQLEGSTISIGETIELLTKEIYPDKPAKEIQMVKNLDEAMRYSIENLDSEITSEHIKKINEKILFSLHKGAGEYKKTQNKIVGNPNFKTTPQRVVGMEIEKFCNKFNSISNRKECLEKLGEIHNDLQRIHPFPDGNSRTTRMIVNLLLAKWRFPILVLKAGSFDKYILLTKLSSKRDDNKLQMFLLHIILHEYLIN